MLKISIISSAFIFLSQISFANISNTAKVTGQVTLAAGLCSNQDYITDLPQFEAVPESERNGQGVIMAIAEVQKNAHTQIKCPSPMKLIKGTDFLLLKGISCLPSLYEPKDRAKNHPYEPLYDKYETYVAVALYGCI